MGQDELEGSSLCAWQLAVANLEKHTRFAGYKGEVNLQNSIGFAAMQVRRKIEGTL